MYKRGANVRIDTTLLGFDHTNWQRGNRTYIFKGNGKFCLRIEKKTFIEMHLKVILICEFSIFIYSRFRNNDRNRSRCPRLYGIPNAIS